MDSSDGISPIENVPVEIMFAIMGQLPDINSLIRFTWASPVAFRIFGRNKGYILRLILTNEIGPNLPIAIARLEAYGADWKSSRPFSNSRPGGYRLGLMRFCKQYLAGQAIKSPVLPQYFTLEKALELRPFHTIVSHYVNSLSTHMGEVPLNGPPLPQHHVDDLERYRIEKMLYITELVSILLPMKYETQSAGRDEDWEIFWVCFAPWEFCQYTEMQRVLSRLCLKEILHDSKHGQLGLCKQLREIFAPVRVTFAIWHTSCKSIVVQAGLAALVEILPHPTQPEPQEIGRPLELLKVVIGLRSELFPLTSPHYRFMKHRDHSWIAAEYKHIWLKELGTQNSKDAEFFPHLTRIIDEYTDFDEAPLACWLYDVLLYGYRSEPHILARRSDSGFLMTSFWSQRRWDLEQEKRMPPLSEMKLKAESYVLDDSKLKPISV